MLKSVTMRNFMCFADKTVTFDKNISIVSGQNGKGKTTIGTAILWGLFNRNYELKDNPVVRKTDVSDKSDVEVEIVIDDTTFKKVQKRKRNKDNPAEYADSNSYYVNEVPVTMKEYNERIGSDVKTMLMGVNINAFLSEKPDALRSYLFSKIDDISDLDVARSNPDLFAISELLEKYKLEEIKAMNKKVVSDSNKDAVILEGQIKEKERDVQLASEIDVSDLELQKSELDKLIAETESKIEDSDKMLAEKQKMSDGIMELKFKLSDMERNANAGIEQKRRDLNGQLVLIDRSISDLERRINTAVNEKADKEKTISEKTAYLQTIREKWTTENNRVFDDSSLICPYCGNEYKEDKKEALRAEFESHKANELKAITRDGERENKNIQALKEDIAKIDEFLSTTDGTLTQYRVDKSTIEHQLEDLKPVDVKTTEEYLALAAEIEEKQIALRTESLADNIRAELKTKLSEYKTDRDRVSGEIAKSNTEQYEKRLEELLEQSRTIEQNKANAERILDLADQLERAKNDAVSEKVNSLFKIVKFQLFEFAKNGSYKNCFIPTIDGKNLLDNNANKALRILGKMDICNTIQHLENFDLPVLLDDGEALDTGNLEKIAELTDRQVIVLRVTDDAELQIK